MIFRSRVLHTPTGTAGVPNGYCIPLRVLHILYAGGFLEADLSYGPSGYDLHYPHFIVQTRPKGSSQCNLVLRAICVPA